LSKQQGYMIVFFIGIKLKKIRLFLRVIFGRFMETFNGMKLKDAQKKIADNKHLIRSDFKLWQ